MSKTRAGLAGLVAGIMILGLASPAAAAAWRCTATNARGATYTATGIGIFSAPARNRAVNNAMNACFANTVIQRSCRIVSCTQTAF